MRAHADHYYPAGRRMRTTEWETRQLFWFHSEPGEGAAVRYYHSGASLPEGGLPQLGFVRPASLNKPVTVIKPVLQRKGKGQYLLTLQVSR